jgi:DNA-binding GntR family transcriptional regulator
MNIVSPNRVPSLNTGVYERLKAMIADRQIPPGTRLVQQTLAKRLGTSPMPVIEALRRLERDGLVSHVPHLGSFVRESTVEDLRELYSIRRGLETEACRMFAQRATPEDKKILVELNERLNASARAGNIDDFIAADLAFHMHIVNGAGAVRLREIIENRHIEQRIFMSAPELKTGTGTKHLIGQHDPIVQAILSGIEQAAGEAMREHLLNAERQYVEAMTSKENKRP